MKKVTLAFLASSTLAVITSCGGGSTPSTTQTSTTPAATETAAPEAEAAASDDAKGYGPVKEVALTTPLDQTMIKGGKDIYDLKCSSCHKLDNTKLVGPGWKDVTKRRKPEWIMNFAINVEENLNKDATAMAMLEECLVRMPNQNLTETDARHVLEFMRSNDGEK